MKCNGCGKEHVAKATKTGMERVPRGWHRHAERTWCGDCWAERYVIRALTFAVASPIVGGDWKFLRAALAEQWSVSTAAANWMTTELYARDVKRDGQEKCPPMPRVYLYPEARARFPTLPSQSVAALEQTIQRKYRAKRFKVIWTCEESLPNYRYPLPFSIPNQGWSCEWIERIDPAQPKNKNRQPVVSARIGDTRWGLRLRGGERSAHFLPAFAQLVNGDAIAGEMAVYRVRAGGDGRDKARDAGGQSFATDIMVKLVGWFPRPPRKADKNGSLKVRSTGESLLLALDAKAERLWVVNADHLRRWSAEHARNLQRFSDDMKAEQRPVPLFASRRAAIVEKQRRRMDAAIHQISAQLVGFARRKRFAELSYDDSDKSFCERLPWFRLRALVEQKCDAAGIKFVVASGDLPSKTGESLAEVITD